MPDLSHVGLNKTAHALLIPSPFLRPSTHVVSPCDMLCRMSIAIICRYGRLGQSVVTRIYASNGAIDRCTKREREPFRVSVFCDKESATTMCVCVLVNKCPTTNIYLTILGRGWLVVLLSISRAVFDDDPKWRRPLLEGEKKTKKGQETKLCHHRFDGVMIRLPDCTRKRGRSGVCVSARNVPETCANERHS